MTPYPQRATWMPVYPPAPLSSSRARELLSQEPSVTETEAVTRYRDIVHPRKNLSEVIRILAAFTG